MKPNKLHQPGTPAAATRNPVKEATTITKAPAKVPMPKRAATKVDPDGNSGGEPACQTNLHNPATGGHVGILHPGTVIIVILEADLTPRPVMITIQGPDGHIEPVRAANPDAVSGGREDEGNPGRPAPQSASHPGPHPQLSIEDLPVCGGSCDRHQLC